MNYDLDDELELFYKIVSDNVAKIRKSNGYSQLKLANAIGHQNATFIGKAELLAENKHFNLEHIFKISVILNVPISLFFEPVGSISYKRDSSS